MLTIKDFNVGDTVYVVLMNSGKNDKPQITEKTVASVGRIYITLEGVWKERYFQWDYDYFMEKVDFGEAKLLFKTRKDADDYLEKCSLALWLGGISVSRAEKYSVEQLRKVKEILG